MISYRDFICADIDDILKKKPKDFEEFLKMMQDVGYECKRGKHIAFRSKSQKRFVRMRSLGENYSEEAILNGKIFAQLYPYEHDLKITLKCTVESGQMFRMLFPEQVKRGYHCPPVQQPYWNTVSAKYSCGFLNPQVLSIIVVDRYLDYFTTMMEDRLWQVLAKPVFRWRNRSGLSMNADRAA